MSNLKAIRRRITSVRNTMQITRAMKLVSAAKLRRAQEAALSGRSFSDRLRDVLSTVVVDLPGGLDHPLLKSRQNVAVRRVVALAGERGLCGGFNTNVLKSIQEHESDNAVDSEFVVIGRKLGMVAKQLPGDVVSEYQGLPEDVGLWPVTDLAENLVEDFIAGRCDEVVLYYTKFESVVRQVVVRETILPFLIEEDGQEKEKVLRTPGQVKYDPQPQIILAELLPLLLKTKLRQAGLESTASEHAARMRAMDSATRNANELIDKLRLFYNRARQKAITTELIDIVGGAEAQSQ